MEVVRFFTAPRLNAQTLVVAGAAVLVFALLAFDARLLNDGDTFWHIRAGEWMLDHRAVPHTDIFSGATPGAPWTAHEWLAEVLLALSYRAGGFAGVMVLTALSVAAAAAILCSFLQRRLSILATVVTLILALACAAPNLLARPHVLALPVMALWCAFLFDARWQGRAPPFASLALMTLWANLHGGYLAGVALAGFLALEAMLETQSWRARWRWLAFAAASPLAALITPHGLEGLLFPVKLMGMESLSGIGEWRPIDFSTIQPIELALGAGVIALITRGVHAPVTRLLLVLALAHVAFQHTRHQMLFGIVATMAMADALAPAFPRAALSPLTAPMRVLAGTAGALALVFLAAGGLRAVTPVVLVESHVAPVSALAAVPDALKSQLALNEYSFGGYLIFEGARPYIDSRADMYGDAYLKRHDAAMRGDRAALREILARNDIGWTMLNPHRPLVTILDNTPGWRRIYADDTAVIHARDGLRGGHAPLALADTSEASVQR